MSFPDVRPILNGTNVDQDVTNRPLNDLIERTNWLKNQVDNLLVQSSRLFIIDEKCSDDCSDSKFVYYDEDNEQWDLASAGIIELGDGVQEKPTPESHVQGIVKDITGPIGNRRGTIYFYGVIEDINVVNFTEENEIIPGKPLYLTGRDTHKGQGTYTTPGVEVFTGKFLPDNTFLFTPYFRNLGETHRHIWFELDFDNWTQLTPLVDGHWLYPYTFFPVWPPISFQSAVLSVNGVNYFHGDYFYLASDGVHYISPDHPPVDDLEQFQAVLYYQVPWGQERRDELLTGGVDSLYARTLNLKIYKQGTTQPASVGDLEILSLPVIKVMSTTSFGHEVVKSLVTDTVTGDIQVFKGPVVERLYPGSDNVSFTEHGGITTTQFGLMDLSVINEFSVLTDSASGWLAWKDISVDPVTGEHRISRGPVLENIYPKYTNPLVQNVYFTAHTTPDPHSFTSTARLDVAILQVVDIDTDTQAGNLVVKNIDITAEGNIDLVRGPVVEHVFPKQSYVQVYEHGTTTPATQGSVDVSVLKIREIKFLHTGIIDPGDVVTVPVDNGHQLRSMVYHDFTILQSMISISSNVTLGTLAMEVYADPLSGVDRHLTDLDLTLDNVTNNIWDKSSEYAVGNTNSSGVESERLYVKLTASQNPPDADFTAYVNPADIDDIYTVEVILTVALRE